MTTYPTRRTAAGSLLAAAAMLTWTLLGPAGRPARADDPPKAPPTPGDEIAAIRKTLLTGGRPEADKVTPDLKRIGKLDLSRADRESWVRVARDAALRRGDRAWLESLRDVPDTFGLDSIYTVLLAYGQLAKADLKQARATLDGLGDPDALNEREKRRVDSIRARIAQLEGKAAEERACVERLVDHLYLWPKQMCQTCHNNVQEPKAMTGLPVTNLWFGERFVELLREKGDAGQVKAAAEKALAAAPGSEKARVRLGFALRALGQDADAEAEFRKLPWAEFPDRQLKKPRMMTAFP
jgi:hypothetical protein